MQRPQTVIRQDNDYVSEDQAYKNLASAVVTQAVKDYRICLSNKMRGLKYCTYGKEINREIIRLEKFFLGDWCCLISPIDGEEIIKVVKAQEGYHETN